MTQKAYQQLLLKRIETSFSEWKEKDILTAREFSDFLHNLKGMSDTMNFKEVSKSCVSQLSVLQNDHDEISVEFLVNFEGHIKKLLKEKNAIDEVGIPKVYCNRFSKETFVLIIDDDVEYVSRKKELFENFGAQVMIALNGKQGIELFYSMRPNFVFIGADLQGMSGFEVLDQIADTARVRHVAIAIMSDEYSRKERIQAYERGAMDYFAKPVDQEVFVAYLFNRDEMSRMINKSVATDGLTGVGNRRHFDDMLNHFAEVKKQTGTIFSLAIVDLDHFKAVNDTYGHPAGDEVLRRIGEVTQKETRESDSVFRYGGEEFAFLINNNTAEEAIVLIERIRKVFSEQVFHEGDRSFSVTFSAGIATYDGDTEKLITAADQALYEAKRSGRNKTVIYNTEKETVKRKLNIIIVDDDRLTRTMLYDKILSWDLPDLDIAVSVYTDGVSFLEADWHNTEDHFIVLLDGVMPDMDGLEVLSRIKNEHTEKNVKVSMMTARTADSDIKTALWLGADDYIMKPAKPEEVFFRIQQMASRLFN